MAEALARLLGVPATTLASQSGGDLSLDALMAMELRHIFRRDLEIDIPVMQILRVQNVSAMSATLSELITTKV